jgi:adenosylhomocysteine nucleosidase
MTRQGVGVVVAMAQEARLLAGRSFALGAIETVPEGTRVLVCGMGPRAAAAAAQSLIDAGVAALAMFGVAGALDPALTSGDLLCPAAVLDESDVRYVIDTAWRARLAVKLSGTVLSDGLLLTVHDPLLTPQSKADAYRRLGAVAVDMETAAVAAAAAVAGLPFLALRAIADGAADSIPTALAGAIDRWGRPRPLAMAGAFLRHPGVIPQLPRLAASMSKASAALRGVAQAAGPALGFAV